MLSSSVLGYKPSGYAKDLLNEPSGGGGTVLSVGGSAPIASTGGANPVISHNLSGVVAGSYTLASVTVDSTGHVTSASNGSGVVASVTASAPIASTGGANPVISHSTSGVVAGSYTLASVTVDSSGHITSASNGSASTDIITGTGGIVDVIGTSSPYGAPVSTGVVMDSSTGLDIYYIGGVPRTITDRYSFTRADNGTYSTANWMNTAGLVYPLGTSQAWTHLISLRVIALAADAKANIWEVEFSASQSTSDVITVGSAPILWRAIRTDFAGYQVGTIYAGPDHVNFILLPSDIVSGQIQVSNQAPGAPLIRWFINCEISSYIY